MQGGKLNIVIDESFGSSGKGKLTGYLADKFGITHVSSSNFPNAGHSLVFPSGYKFVAKAIPTALALNQEKGIGITGYISPGSGFDTKQLFKEWLQCNKPRIFIHDRASIVTANHAKREREGQEATKHIASTMQGSGTAYADKILRKADVVLARTIAISEWELLSDEPVGEALRSEFIDKVQVIPAFEFRNLTHNIIDAGNLWLHEGSQGYALSIDHGYEYPFCTSRNCTSQAALDHMAVPPQKLGDVYLNLRSFPIRVGNVLEEGKQTGYSGGFPPDSEELSWHEVAARAGMPPEEAEKLAERERTTVTRRVRRVSTRSDMILKDAVRVNGVTKLAVNFVQYWNWRDAGLKGGREALEKLSKETRSELAHIEELVNIPVTIIGTGALHDEVIDLDT